MVQTRQAWIGKTEVVEVVFDPKVVTRKQLAAVAKRNEFWHVPSSAEDGSRLPLELRMDKEQKYYLLQTPLKGLPMSKAQACRVNASIKGDWKQYLSPSQLAKAVELSKPKRPVK